MADNLQKANEPGYDSRGGRNVSVTNQEVNVSTMQNNSRFSLGAATSSLDTWDISAFDEVVVRLASDGTTDVLTITASADGLTFDDVPCEARDQSGAYVATVWTSSATPASFTIPFNAKKLRLSKAGTTDTVSGSWSARNSGRGAV